ncbi:DMT family transporter [Crocosphaera sp.]|uniref:DMT family transporter n=1 Tax=Crocosphaera sp. TaxID=2729996 RepID=UPI0026051A87|nr:DMT family transporter [Crocosphaera sp.]MDJ0580040.1 DMT family transporter [Crocosphaera sp.]
MLSWLNKIPGRGYLLVGVMIFGVANSVTRKLMDIGANNLIDGRNPISFCNVLFVGNLCALIALIGFYYPQLKPKYFRNLSSKSWSYLLLVALLSGALAPALFFGALGQTAVNNVVLVGRIEPPLILFLSVIFLQARVNGWVVSGAIVSAIGVVLTVVLQPPQNEMMQMSAFQLGIGETMAIAGAIFSAIANIISQVSLKNVPLGLFNVVRTGFGTVVFFAIASSLFGIEHFMDVSSPFLWKWMIFYGTVIVVIGQLSWFAGLKRSNASEVSLANSFNPIAGVLAAFFVLGETPTAAQYMGGVVILGGIILNQIGIVKQNKLSVKPDIPSSEKFKSSPGFKGV